MFTGTASRRVLVVALSLLAACGRPEKARDRRELAATDSAAMLPVVLSTGWESGLGTWTAQTTSGTCSWHVVTNPEQLVLPYANWWAIYAPDNGQHLPARSGTRVAWFGEDATASYIGTPFDASGYNGGASTAVQAGTLTSPAVSLAGATRSTLEFDAWWETEGPRAADADVMAVQISTDGGASFGEVTRLDPTFQAPGAGVQVAYTSAGPAVPPRWQHYAVDLSAYAGQTVQVRFSFGTGDLAVNGFRGWTLDNVEVTAGTAALPAPAITSVAPAAVPNYAVFAIEGANFVQGAQVRLVSGGSTADVPAANVLQVGTNRIIVLEFSLPVSGTYDVTVTNPDGQSATLPASLTVLQTDAPWPTGVTPGAGSAGTATPVTITGTLFVNGTTVTAGGLPATAVTFGSDTSLTATFPALPVGYHTVTATGPDGRGRTMYPGFLVSRPNEGSTLAVTSPAGGETWLAGSTHPITWTQTGVTTVRIELWRDGAYDRTLATGVDATLGTWSWAIPADLPRSGAYLVRVANQLGVSSGYSPATFTVPVTFDVTTSVSGAGTLSCTSPVVAGQPSTCTLGTVGVTLVSLVDNGVDVTASVSGNTYTIAAVNAPHTVVATFSSNVTTVAVQSGGGQAAAVGTAFASPVCFRVLDLWAGPLAGRTVAFTVPPSGATAILGSASVVSDASGDACVTLTAGTVVGGYLLTAQAGGVTGTAGLSNGPGPASALARVSGDGQTATVGAAFGTALAAQVTDLYGNPVPGVTVSFAAPGSGASAALSAASAVTGAGGVASVTATAGTVAGVYQVTATTAGVAAPVTFGLTNAAGAPAAIAANAGSTPQAAVVGGNAFANPLAVTVRDANGNGVQGITVTFAAPPAGARANLSATSAVTTASGVAQVTATTGTVAGNYSVTASIAGGFSTSFALTNTVGAPAALVRISGDGQTATVGAAFPAALAVQVDDAQGNPVPGVTVSFAVPGAGATAVLSAPSAVTAADGRASVTATAGTVAGGYAATASVAGGLFATFALTNTVGAPATVTAVAGSTPQSAVVGGVAFANPLAVAVRDTHGNGISGVTVTFTAPTSGALAVLSLPSAVTNASGVAQVTATTGTVAGAYQVTAAVVGVATPATFALTNTVGAPATVTAVAGSTPQSAVVGGVAFANPLAVAVRDTHGNGISGVTVTFTAPTSGALAVLSLPSAVTNASGVAQVTATTGTVAGAYQVTAAVVGVATPATFALTNSVGAPSVISAAAGSTPQTATVGGVAFANPLAVAVVDAYANPVPGVTVTFAAPAGGARAVLSAATAVTNASGAAQVTATTGAIAGSYSVTASIAGGLSTSFALTNSAGAPSVISAAAGSTPQTATVGGIAFTNPLAVTVRDALANPVPGVTVTFAAPATGARAELSATSAVTNASGAAQVTATTGTVAGSYSVTASVAGVATPATFALTNSVGAPASVTAAAGSTPQSATAGGAMFQNPLAVTVRDVHANPVPGVTVTFAGPTTGARALLLAASAVTDASGAAQVFAEAGTVAGSYTVTATVAGVATPAAFALTNSVGAPAFVLAAAGSTPQAATVGGVAFANPLAVTVRDAWSNRVPGVTVTFAAPATGARPVLSATSVVTNASGEAQVTATTGTVAGSYSVTATVAGVPTPATFALTNTVGPPTAVTAAAGSTPQAATVGGTAFTNPLAVTVRDTHANPVPGVTVTFAGPTTGARAVLSAATAVTNASGAAQVTATTGTVAGSYNVTASTAGGLSATFALTNTVGAPAALVLVSGDAQSATVGTAFATPLALRIEDAQGNPVAGVLVSFAAPASGATAVTSAASVSTGADGLASVTATAGTIAGAYSVTATAAGAAAPLSFHLVNQAGVPTAVSAAPGSTPQAATAGGSPFANPLAVTVRDAHGNPVPGVTVGYSAPASGPRAALSATSATTNAEGVASVTATAGAVAGSYNVTASIAGGLSTTFALTNTVGAPAELLLVSGDRQSATVHAAFGTALAVLAQDALGNPVPGVLVSFAAPASGATAALSAAGLVTGADGSASVTATAGTVAGVYQVTASASGVAAPVTFHLENLPGAAATLAAAPGAATQSATVGTAFGQPLAVTVRDADGNGVPGVTVTWAPPGSGATAALSATTAVTDAAGTASVGATAGTVAGAYAVTASVSGVAIPATFALTNTAGAPGTVEVLSGGSQQAVVGTAYAAPLEVIVRDASQNPVDGVTVAFSAPASGASAQLSAASAVTGADGHASVTATAGTVAGGYQVTATVSGAAASAVFALTNLAGAPANVTASPTSSGQSSRVGEPFAAPLAVVVRDAHGNATPGITVAFVCPATGVSCTVSPASAVTDAQGRAETVATAGATPGAYAATATAGALAPVSFDLENLVGLPGSLEIVAGGNQRAAVLTAFATPLAVAVLDSFRNPVAGVTVTFTVASDGAQGATLSSPTAVTDTAGQASVTATANAVGGSYAVTAVAQGVATPASFALTNGGIPAVLDVDVDFSVEFGGPLLHGLARISVSVGPDVGGAVPGGSIRVTSAQGVSPAPGGSGTASGASVVGTLVDGAVVLDVVLVDFTDPTITIAYEPDAASSATWEASTVTRVLETPSSGDTGGCGTGGGSGLALLPLALLALWRRRRGEN